MSAGSFPNPLPPIYGRRFTSDRLLVELCPKQPYSVRYRPNWHILGFALESQSGYDAFESDRIREYHARAHTFAFTPAGCETFSESQQGGAYLVFAVSPDFFAGYLDDIAPTQSVGLRHVSNLRDPHVSAVARAAREFMAADRSSGQLYYESLAGQFAVHTILALSSRSKQSKPPHLLDDRRLNQVMEFIAANLSEDLSLAGLARVAEMTPFHFARSFKATVGQTPYAFVMHRRLTKAQTLLAKTTMPIAQIALDCGFGSQSHLTRYFSQLVGVTPNRYRQKSLKADC